MPQSLAQIYVHLVFSTKNRVPLIHAPYTTRLHAYIAATLNAIGCLALKVGGVSDHVHILFSLAKTTTLSDSIKHAKIESSKWMKAEAKTPDFAWQAGYGAFSVSASQKDDLILYISKQEEHHQKQTFQDEFRALLEKYNLSYDEAHVWG